MSLFPCIRGEKPKKEPKKEKECRKGPKTSIAGPRPRRKGFYPDKLKLYTMRAIACGQSRQMPAQCPDGARVTRRIERLQRFNKYSKITDSLGETLWARRGGGAYKACREKIGRASGRERGCQYV